MDAQKMYNLIQRKEAFNAMSLNEIKAFLLKYPFCQTARMLFLKNLSELKTEQFQKEYLISSNFVGDFNKLYELLHFEEQIVVSAGDPKTDELVFEDGEVDEVVESQIAEFERNPSDNADLLDIDEDERGSAKLSNSGFELIEKFIEENPRLEVKKMEEEIEREIEDVSLDSVKENEDIYSEKLAKIYELQKNYLKAIEVYKKLSLKFPEKNTYFAEQIERLKENLN